MPVTVVVGGQFGSEGKGKIAAVITQHEDIDICIRCGGPNSGHSFVAADGVTMLVRQVPTGFVNPRTRLLIPAGGLIDLNVFTAEIHTLGLDARRVGIDRNAMIVEDSDRETEARLGLRERLSSTLCGVGAAVARRALRGADVRLARDAATKEKWLRDFLTDVSSEANEALDHGKKVLVEGTQGFGLSLYHSQEYPKATSRDTTAAGFLSEVGLSPRLVSDIVVVFRTFPIRVAGEQAGTLRNEITWEMLQEESGSPYSLHEFTSVTRKMRRVARFDWDLAESAVRMNRPTKLAINCVDYFDYADHGRRLIAELSERSRHFIADLEARFSVPVVYVGTGPELSSVLITNAPAGAAVPNQGWPAFDPVTATR
jgi:adenylosuccinate synthase